MIIKHSPLPWLCIGQSGVVFDADNFTVSRTTKCDDDLFIVRAANSYEAMRDALDAAETILRCTGETTSNAGGAKPIMTTSRALKLVRAALALTDEAKS